MISMETFVGIVDNTVKVQRATNRLCNAIGFGGDCEYDACVNAIIDVIINDLQKGMDEICANNHIDIGEIFINWYDKYCNDKDVKKYILKIDKDEYKPETPYDFYQMINTLFEKFPSAKKIDY